VGEEKRKMDKKIVRGFTIITLIWLSAYTTLRLGDSSVWYCLGIFASAYGGALLIQSLKENHEL
jgi:hypothetical protein